MTMCTRQVESDAICTKRKYLLTGLVLLYCNPILMHASHIHYKALEANRPLILTLNKRKKTTKMQQVLNKGNIGAPQITLGLAWYVETLYL